MRIHCAGSANCSAVAVRTTAAGNWGGRWDSNPRQPRSQPGALPTELRPPLKTFCEMARPAGVEPATTGLEGRCSIQLSYGRTAGTEDYLTGRLVSSVGRGSRIRTCDPLLPKQMRYQTAPCPVLRCHPSGVTPGGPGGRGRESYPSGPAGSQFNRVPASGAPPGGGAARLVLENHALLRQFLADAIRLRPVLLAARFEPCRDQRLDLH